jgi:hypothetical protein
MVPGERWTCEACNKPLVAARTMSGLIVRIDRDPSEYGTVLLQPHDGVLTAITMGGPLLDLARQAGVELRRNHLKSCDFAEVA